MVSYSLTKPARLAIFLSGNGSNFASILNAINTNQLDAEVVVVISNNSEAGGLRIASECGILSVVIERSLFASGEEFGATMLGILKDKQTDLIVLAGYMRKIPPLVIKNFPKRIVNIHPALLPKFGGKGMYGHYVHEAVIAAGETESGVTVHYVDEIYDNGDIIGQRSIPVLVGETPESLASRVLEVEHKMYPEILQQLIRQ
jgi:phosphoribosylglycinamide formyltransferase-1